MGLQRRRFRSLGALLAFLDKLAADEHATWVFRGHSNKDHRLQTSLERYWSIVHEEWNSTIDHMLEQFRDGLVRTGLPRPATNDRLTWMELARHHGAPAPLLDFSWSPYVALFFAFNRLSHQQNKRSGSSLVYALNVTQLAKHWARENATDPSGPDFAQCYHEFLNPSSGLFSDGLPENTVRFIPWPGEHAMRMQRQMGAFLYCTLNYGWRKVEDLEGHLELLNDGFDSPVLPNRDDATLIKITLPHSMGTDAFKRLEIVGVTGSSLFGSAEGVADDIWNSFNYNRRLFLRNEGQIGG